MVGLNDIIPYGNVLLIGCTLYQCDPLCCVKLLGLHHVVDWVN